MAILKRIPKKRLGEWYDEPFEQAEDVPYVIEVDGGYTDPNDYGTPTDSGSYYPPGWGSASGGDNSDYGIPESPRIDNPTVSDAGELTKADAIRLGVDLAKVVATTAGVVYKYEAQQRNGQTIYVPRQVGIARNGRFIAQRGGDSGGLVAAGVAALLAILALR